jgi:hypothetical protein
LPVKADVCKVTAPSDRTESTGWGAKERGRDHDCEHERNRTWSTLVNTAEMTVTQASVVIAVSVIIAVSVTGSDLQEVAAVNLKVQLFIDGLVWVDFVVDLPPEH